jgi:hypothetical protein
MTATDGGGLSFGSQSGEVDSMTRWELKDVQDSKNRRRESVAVCFRRRFLVKDKDVPLV